MARLLQNRHELKYCEGPADLQVRKFAVQLAEDAGVVPTDVEHFVTLQVQVSVQGLDEHSLGACRTLKDLERRGDGTIVKVSRRAHTSFWDRSFTD